MKARSKVSISLSSQLLAEIDEEARRKAETRSRIIEIWLQLAARRRAARELEEATLRYYQQRSEIQRAEDDEWSELSARAARRLPIDAPSGRPKPRRSR